ncbi:hypothetical protein KC343_g7415 [Hortaea werneckii]|nr:hypothetical protein KC352_g17995 [Hortaea werneckii]KAI7563362.1 hypothetical protein KC317_g7785 [Hortaea werneckii]KAI7613582.1 hypothetical protein KC346_g7305 [Hortaea werneckii]KAI7623144.1 hypothetical protein KC343_g7415 [Hortaea werneckii]KAI7661321.1 hypothetical protein KC319_g8438 [Hortaea werneckii]
MLPTSFALRCDSLDKHQCRLGQLDDHEPATAATFSVSYYDDDNSRVTINDLVVTHRIYCDATAGQHQESTPGNNAVTGSGPSSKPLQYTGLMLAESKAGPKEEKYIMIDPEDEDGGGRSGGKKLHGHQITFATCRWNNTNGPHSSGKNVLHATPIRITELLITLPDEEALEAVYRSDMAIRSSEDAFDAAKNMRLFSLLTQGGVPKLQAQYVLSYRDPWAVSSQVLGDVNIHTMLAYDGTARARSHSRAEVLHYHMRHAAEQTETFKSDTNFKIKGHADTYSLDPLPTFRIFSPRHLSKICLVHVAVELDDTTRRVSGQDPEGDEGSGSIVQKVEWGVDSVRGLKDDRDGLIEFQHEGTGKEFRGIPRAQLVREGYPTGFVIISSTVEEGKEDMEPRTLAVRDHYLLWHNHNDDRSGEEGDEYETPAILPLTEDEMDAIFELESSAKGDGEIEARRMEFGEMGTT